MSLKIAVIETHPGDVLLSCLSLVRQRFDWRYLTIYTVVDFRSFGNGRDTEKAMHKLGVHHVYCVNLGFADFPISEKYHNDHCWVGPDPYVEHYVSRYKGGYDELSDALSEIAGSCDVLIGPRGIRHPMHRIVAHALRFNKTRYWDMPYGGRFKLPRPRLEFEKIYDRADLLFDAYGIDFNKDISPNEPKIYGDVIYGPNISELYSIFARSSNRLIKKPRYIQ